MYSSRRDIDYMNMTSRKVQDTVYSSESNYDYSNNNQRNSKAKNLKVNRNIKKILAKGIVIVAAGAIAVGSLVAIIKEHNEKTFQENVQKIYTYYGLESDEVSALRYTDLALKLDELDFDEYILSDNTSKNLNVNQVLATPSYVDLKLNKFNKENANNPKDLDNLYEYLSNVAFLKEQDSLIGKYVSTTAYYSIYKDYVSALKEYTAEEYNLPDPNKITFEYSDDHGDGHKSFKVKYPGEFTTYETNPTNEVIEEGILYMVNLQRLLRNNPSNKKLLEEYVDALSKTIELKNEVKSKNLYNEESEEQLMGR